MRWGPRGCMRWLRNEKQDCTSVLGGSQPSQCRCSGVPPARGLTGCVVPGWGQSWGELEARTLHSPPASGCIPGGRDGDTALSQLPVA